MSVKIKDLEKVIMENNKKAIAEIEKKAMNLWVEVAEENGVEYKVEGEIAKPVDEQAAMIKHFGNSLTPPTYWFDKARDEWEEKVKDVKS